MRTVMAELIALPAVARHLSGLVSGLDIRYEQSDHEPSDPAEGGTHPLLGARLADRELKRADGEPDHVARLLHPARGVLITADATGDTAELAAPWADRVDVVRVETFPAGPEEGDAPTDSVLVRPDGYVAWTAPDGGDLPSALRRWFGEPARAA